MAKNRSNPDGTKWCGQCQEWKPIEEFAVVPKGWRVTGCNTCGRENMAKWARTGMVGKLPDAFTDKD